jgi:gliding motility-associated-like protein
MQLLLSWGGSTKRGAWLLAWLLIGLAGLRPELAQASHLRAGDIQARVDSITGNPNHIYFRLTLYRDKGGVDQPTVTIFFGDGTRQDNIPKATTTTILAAETDIFTYNFDHIYGGSGNYTISFVGENRNANVVNMSSSASQTFYISTSITINPAFVTGNNHTPVLRAPAIDRAAVGQVFLHNPAGYDADGDSLAYKLQPSRQVQGGVPTASIDNRPDSVRCTNYVYPSSPTIAPTATQVAYNGVPAGVPGAAAIIRMDVVTGQMTWNAPSRAGFYNVAFVVEEWRRFPNGQRRQIGSVIRDMQIIVTATTNQRPTITVPPDICVVAGTPVTLNVSATDGTAAGATSTPISLFAYSGILPPATFTQTTTGTTSTGTFRWTPDCSNVSNQPYIVVFKAQDNPAAASGSPILIDEKPVRITVVGPPPQNVRGTPASSAAGLVSLITWDRYTCQNASRLLIFRREGCYAYTPGTCDTGLPAGSGYVQVGSVPVTATTFTDDNGGAGLSRGRTYSYRVYATFPLPSGGNSIVSNEACLAFSGRSARLTNVDVNATDINQGQITVKWSQPRADNNAAFGAPYGYRLGQAIGNSTTFTTIATITNLADTTYIARGLNTRDNQYRYQITFFNTDRSTGTAVEKSETAAPATSVRTSLVPDGLANTITVNWAYQVPWDNSRQVTRIFRLNPAPGSTFTQVGTATPGANTGTFVDRDPTLQRGLQYCYYVQTNGQYADPVNSAGQLIFANLLNNSQQICTILQATPCTPVLSIRPTNCDSLAALPSFPAPDQRYQNNLRWTVGSTPAGCSTAAAYYRILRSDSPNGPYAALDSTTRLDYVDRFLTRANYCYIVQAVSAQGIRSALSNTACQDNCVFFVLPNIFTPNGDGRNDVFRPKTASALRRTHIQIFNRWGRKVYESDQDPYINWTGGGATGESSTSGLVSGGIYYYLAEVEFDDTAQTKRTFKGWVEIVR